MKSNKKVKNVEKKLEEILRLIKSEYKITKVPDIEISENSLELIKVNL